MKTIMDITIQKSYGSPTKGVYCVFMPKIELRRASGTVINASVVSVFMTSFCFVKSMALFVSRSAVIVSN